MATPDKPKTNGSKAQNGGNRSFEAELFPAADKLCKNLEPSDYKHVVLGLRFEFSQNHSKDCNVT
jgi:type I restriction enzyme M protein